MNNFCPNCGTNNNASDNFCRICATPLSQNQPDPRPVRPAPTSRPTPVNKPAPTNRPAQTSRPAPVNIPAPTNRPVPVNRPVVNPDINSTQTVTPTEGINQNPVAEKTDKKQNKEKKKDKKAKKNQAVDTTNLDPKQKKKLKRKKRLKKFLKAILIIFIIAAALAFTWFAVGNQITLTIHTDKDVETMNSGSLEMPGAHYSQYSDMPDYVVRMLGADPESPDYGPVMSEVIPYIYVERNKVNGFFGGTTVDYTIYAPDLETWLLNLDDSKTYTQETMLEELKEYLPDAPMREQKVTIEYAHDGIFGWQGNYMSLEFSNAISGGVNTAYNELYAEFSKELEANIQS